MKNAQENCWSGTFGSEWLDRNNLSYNEAYNQRYMTNYGISREALNAEFLKDIPKESRFLEIGCGNGIQLNGLQAMGFTNLYGMDIQHYAIEKAKRETHHISLLQGSAFDIPFKDGFFDVVFTNGVLIHIDPAHISTVFSEMYRCTSKYIWGLEFYEEKVKEINYRSNMNVLWKADYEKMMRDQNPDLELVNKKLLPYFTEAEKGNTDNMFLLKKKSAS